MKKVMTGIERGADYTKGYTIIVPAEKVSECKLIDTDGKLCTWEVPDISMVVAEAVRAEDGSFASIGWFVYKDGEPHGEGFEETLEAPAGRADKDRFEAKCTSIAYMVDSMTKHSGGAWVEL